jgi:hypothetical protein
MVKVVCSLHLLVDHTTAILTWKNMAVTVTILKLMKIHLVSLTVQILTDVITHVMFVRKSLASRVI